MASPIRMTSASILDHDHFNDYLVYPSDEHLVSHAQFPRQTPNVKQVLG